VTSTGTPHHDGEIMIGAISKIHKPTRRRLSIYFFKAK